MLELMACAAEDKHEENSNPPLLHQNIKMRLLTDYLETYAKKKGKLLEGVLFQFQTKGPNTYVLK